MEFEIEIDKLEESIETLKKELKDKYTDNVEVKFLEVSSAGVRFDVTLKGMGTRKVYINNYNGFYGYDEVRHYIKILIRDCIDYLIRSYLYEEGIKGIDG